MRLGRNCTRCKDRFIPSGKGCRLCPECIRKSIIARKKTK